MTVEKGAVRIHFEHTGSGLAARDDKALTEFRLAARDKRVVSAEAVIDGDTVVVSSKQVEDPAAVRFAWHRNAEPNLMNKDGLPAAPFRTDRWE